MKVNGRMYASGDDLIVGDVMTVTADSNPAKRNYTWENTTSNKSIATGKSLIVTEDILGNQSLTAVVCNIIPIPSPHPVCSDFPVNIVVISKCFK